MNSYNLQRTFKNAQLKIEDFFYTKILKTLLKTSKLGHGLVVDGAESGENYEHMYNGNAEGRYLIGKFVDQALLNLESVQSTVTRKDDVKMVVWNEVENNMVKGNKTKVLDLASGGARYLRELQKEHLSGALESICVDRESKCINLGKEKIKEEGLKNIRFIKGNIFALNKLNILAQRIAWKANVVIASGIFIYLDDDIVKKMLNEIYDYLAKDGLIIFTSYETIKSRKLMRKTMKTTTGETWILRYRKPEYWRELLVSIGFSDVFITRDRWRMNNICTARKR